MIESSKLNSALFAIQETIIKARMMAYERESYENIASILDYAEYLPLLIAEEADNTVKFRTCLEQIAQRFDWWRIVERYEKEKEKEKNEGN